MKNRGAFIILSGILITAAVLRLIHPFAIPFNADELSALIRTHFSTIHDEIKYGVMLRDTHPPGVQIFLYYWTKLFGYSEIVVKLPFIVCGILSVFYMFRLGTEWFNSTVGLVCAAYIATIQYTIMYSQLARPYSSGLFLTLVMVWYWNKVVFKSGGNYYKNLLLYILFSALCAYNHHFSLLLAAIVGLTGLFFLRGKYLLKYALAGTGIFLLYIPNLFIFFHQLKEGGLDWLGKPGNAFIIHYIEFVLQFSTLAYITSGLLTLFGIYSWVIKRNVPARYYFISLTFFVIPFLIAFFYSQYVKSVLHYAALIFSFPFLLLGVFGLLPKLNVKVQFAIVLAICSLNISVLVNERKYYSIFYESHFERQIAINDSLFRKVGEQNFTALSARLNDSVTTFYFQKYHTNLPTTWMPDSNWHLLIQYLEKHKTPYLTFDYIAPCNPLYLPIILNYYPYIAMEYNLYGGINYIFSSVPANGKSPYIFQSVDDYEKPCEYWQEADKNFTSDTISFSGKHSYRMDSLHEWGPTFKCALNKMTNNKHNFILVSLSLYPLETLKNVQIVLSIDSGSKNLNWSATKVSNFIPDDARCKWVKAYHAIDLPEEINFHDTAIKVHIYVRNGSRKNFYMDDFAVRTLEGDPNIYWMIEKI